MGIFRPEAMHQIGLIQGKNLPETFLQLTVIQMGICRVFPETVADQFSAGGRYRLFKNISPLGKSLLRRRESNGKLNTVLRPLFQHHGGKAADPPFFICSFHIQLSRNHGKHYITEP